MEKMTYEQVVSTPFKQFMLGVVHTKVPVNKKLHQLICEAACEDLEKRIKFESLTEESKLELENLKSRFEKIATEKVVSSDAGIGSDAVNLLNSVFEEYFVVMRHDAVLLIKNNDSWYNLSFNEYIEDVSSISNVEPLSDYYNEDEIRFENEDYGCAVFYLKDLNGFNMYSKKYL